MSAVESTETASQKQDSEISQEDFDGRVEVGRACCGKFQGLSADPGEAEVSKDQGVRTGVPGRGTSSRENQGVCVATVAPVNTVQGGDQGW